MIEYLKKHPTMIAAILISILLATFLVLPFHIKLVSIVMFVINISLAMVLILKKHWHTYQQAEYIREKMIRNLALDLLGFLLVMGAAIYMGGAAGRYIGLRAGLWFGLLAGFAGGFLAAWVVRSVWGKLVLARI